MLSENTRGVFVISATPFHENGEVDYDSLDSAVEFYVGAGVHGITALGMMGEAHKLTMDEALQVSRHLIRRVAGRVAVVVGVSNSALANMALLANAVMDAGADGVLIAPIPNLRSDDQIVGYYEEVFAALGPGIPVIYQDYPQSTGVILTAAVFTRLTLSFPQLVMLKAEDCPGLSKITLIRQEAARNGLRRVSLLGGNGGLFFPQELRRGVDGTMTGLAFPDMLVQVYQRFQAGDREGAEDLFDKYLPIVRYENQPGFGLAVRKEILRRRGAIASATVRRPGPSLSGEDRAELDVLLSRLEKALEER